MKDITLTLIYPFCGEAHMVAVSEDGLRLWQGGVLIQDAMPDLTPTEREQLISRLCPTCQAKIFG